MVAVRDIHLKDNFTLDEWVSSLTLSESDKNQLRTVYQYCLTLGDEALTNRLLVRGVEMVGILLMLSMDLATLKAAILYPFVEAGLISQEKVNEDFGPKIAKLVEGVLEMEAIRSLQTLHRSETSPEQVDNVRRMLLAMVEDVRAVVIKLAERIACLREAKKADEETRVLMAQEITNIYAPLRTASVSVSSEWELEDLAFRYLHPDTYKQIAKQQLDEKRLDRERYIREFVQSLRDALAEAGVEAEVYGRPKHIYSIWRKMQKKHLEFNELFDVRAVRVITKRLQDCYAALGIVHTHFHHIPREFDDYVANPKPNGYQSIHTVVVGRRARRWRSRSVPSRCIRMRSSVWLRTGATRKGPRPLPRPAPSKTRSNGCANSSPGRRISRRAAPCWTICAVRCSRTGFMSSPQGRCHRPAGRATPLDFAYHVHSMIGHRCIGTKIDGRIVPFTYTLQTGDQVEVITQKEPNPSRDWMNPNAGFLRSSRARAKVATWFRKLDRDKNIAAGKELLEKELDRHNLTLSKVDKVVLERFHAEELEDLLAGIGSGDIRINQLLNYLDTRYNKPTAEEEDRRLLEKLEQKANVPFRPKPKDHIVVEGVGNLMTHIARCCQPIPGTPSRASSPWDGVSIHREDCEQLKELSRRNPERLIDAVWGELLRRLRSHHPHSLQRQIRPAARHHHRARQREDQRDGVRSRSNVREQTAEIDMELEIYNINAFNRALAKLSQLNDVISAKRL